MKMFTKKNSFIIFIGYFLLLLLFLVSFRLIYVHYKYTPDETTLILDRNGEVIYELFDDKHRILASYDEFPESLKKATVAIEDERFYEHPGVDPIAIGRALKNIIFKDKVEGASTITQQFAKNAFLSNKRTLDRKIREAVVAFSLESFATKEKILEDYLNEVSYGGVYYGAKTAAKHYFGKELGELTLAESALLAGLPRAPSRLDPEVNLTELKQRQELVLKKMKKLGYINEEEEKAAIAEQLNFKFNHPVFKAPHFAVEVRKELEREFKNKEIGKMGLVVKTTIDLNLQNKLEEIVAKEVNSLKGYNVTNGAALVMDPKSGEVLAMVGSADFYNKNNGGEYNVLYANRQPGSTFKPILYSLAFERGFTPATLLLDEKTVYLTSNGEYIPENYDLRFHGAVSIRKALANSYNIPATRMHAVLGVPSLIKYADKLGIENINPGEAGLSLALGGYSIRPIDLAEAYSVFANEGNLAGVNLISGIKDRGGRELLKSNKLRKGVVPREVAYLISDILSDNKSRSDTFGENSKLNIPGKRVAVKTGTSNKFRDNWTVGYTPEYLVLSWVGNNDNTGMSRVASGVTGATPIWNEAMSYLLKDKEDGWYDKPSKIITEKINPGSGGKYCGNGREVEEIFVKGTEPTECKKEVASRFTLIEKTAGGEREIQLADENQMSEFTNDPIAFIQRNKDMFLADETPAEFKILEGASASAFTDPLAEITGERNKITLSKLDWYN